MWAKEEVLPGQRPVPGRTTREGGVMLLVVGRPPPRGEANDSPKDTLTQFVENNEPAFAFVRHCCTFQVTVPAWGDNPAHPSSRISPLSVIRLPLGRSIKFVFTADWRRIRSAASSLDSRFVFVEKGLL